jgi:hypothetical protein
VPRLQLGCSFLAQAIDVTAWDKAHLLQADVDGDALRPDVKNRPIAELAPAWAFIVVLLG